MKVRDLIQILERLDPEMAVVIPLDSSGDFTPVQRVGIDTVGIVSGNMSLAYAHEAGAIEVVRLFDTDLDGGRATP